MIVAKLFELRDSATFIPILAVRMEEIPDQCHGTTDAERYLMRRCGYPETGLLGFSEGPPSVVLQRADGSGKSTSDPYEWHDRTFRTAHNYILENWDKLKDGQVICVEFILGERKEPKRSESFDV